MDPSQIPEKKQKQRKKRRLLPILWFCVISQQQLLPWAIWASRKAISCRLASSHLRGSSALSQLNSIRTSLEPRNPISLLLKCQHRGSSRWVMICAWAMALRSESSEMETRNLMRLLRKIQTITRQFKSIWVVSTERFTLLLPFPRPNKCLQAFVSRFSNRIWLVCTAKCLARLLNRRKAAKTSPLIRVRWLKLVSLPNNAISIRVRRRKLLKSLQWASSERLRPQSAISMHSANKARVVFQSLFSMETVTWLRLLSKWGQEARSASSPHLPLSLFRLSPRL